MTLTTEAALAYWDQRHRDQDVLRSGGHIGTDRPTNEVFYALRLSRLLEFGGVRVSEQQPVFALDAGCGKGWFAVAMSRCGWVVDAFDVSPTAVDAARATGAPVRWAVARLDTWRSPVPYDLVYAVDVLFHLVDDDVWEASLRNLARCVGLGGRLVVTDAPVAERRVRGDYIVQRPQADYVRVLGEHGLVGDGFYPYAFRSNEIGFAVFTRRA